MSTSYLHRDLKVDALSHADLGVSESESPFHDDRLAAYRYIGDRSVPLSFSYRGTLPRKIADGTNGVDEHRLELSIYSAWFPVPTERGPFEGSLQLRLPPGWSAVSNGRPSVGGFESRDESSVGDRDFRLDGRRSRGD